MPKGLLPFYQPPVAIKPGLSMTLYTAFIAKGNWQDFLHIAAQAKQQGCSLRLHRWRWARGGFAGSKR